MLSKVVDEFPISVGDDVDEMPVAADLYSDANADDCRESTDAGGLTLTAKAATAMGVDGAEVGVSRKRTAKNAPSTSDPEQKKLTKP